MIVRYIKEGLTSGSLINFKVLILPCGKIYSEATTILFSIVPMPSISILTTSPSLSQFRGCRNAATPLFSSQRPDVDMILDSTHLGVPVMMTVPFLSVIP